VHDGANVMTIEIPEELIFDEYDLSYGRIRDFLMFNDKIQLISIGVLAVDLDDASQTFKTTTSRGAVDNRYHRDYSGNEFSISNLHLDTNIDGIYEQFVSETNNKRRLVMQPYSDFKINPKDYIICIGEIKLETAREFFRDEVSY
jgi:hypothetical protein